MTKQDDFRNAHTAIVRAIAALKAENIPVPATLYLAVYALRQADKPAATAFRGEGAAGAM
jgi:transcriptional regulator of NAD metabolism